MKRAVILLFLSLTSHLSFACDCIMHPIESYIDKVDIIFIGRVIEIKEVNTDLYMNTAKNREFFKDKGYEAKVLVIERLKAGKVKADTLVFTSTFTNCDRLYTLGQSYLFFADKVKNGKFMMAHCTHSGEIEEAEESIKKLRITLRK